MSFLNRLNILHHSNIKVQCNRKRYISKYLDQDKTAKAIRQKFLDYFINNNHNFIRSSPVVPYFDPTVAFVNSGMNQFKSIFLGIQEPQFDKVANSQKCVRVGGKHNDLDVVGWDGYHHTFFEMLGNWSFGDYFKAEACELAWKLLVDVYKLSPERLFVTYFEGDISLGLSEDLETKEIWKSIGVPANRILPFGVKENFWEMGPIGPCGPCTEIHYDHIGTGNRAKFVNKGLFDLTEIWNIVFMQNNRHPDGSISMLSKKHIDTGLGFERLTSVLQGTTSNYDTDNFTYLLKAIKKICRNIPSYKGNFGEKDWNNMDTSYRILSDHTRMITACLADGMIPEQNQKLRRVIRKSFSLSESIFLKERGLVKELTNYVVEHLGPVYIEMEKNISQIHQILDYEEEVFKEIRKAASKEWKNFTEENPKLKLMDIFDSPSLVLAIKDINRTQPTAITGDLAFKLYDTFGLDKPTIMKLSNVLDLNFDEHGFTKILEEAKLRSKTQFVHNADNLMDTFIKLGLKKTDDLYKYDYYKTEDKYLFKSLNVTVLKIIKDDKIVEKVFPEDYCTILLDKTNLYTETGGQAADKGKINFENGNFEVDNTENLHDYILHKGVFKSKTGHELGTNAVGILSVDETIRLNCMRNHTATHLLNAFLKKIKGAVCQKSSRVNEKYLNLDIGIFGPKLSNGELDKIEASIKNIISRGVNVNVCDIDGQKLLSFDEITTVPGEVYPDQGIRLVEIGNSSDIVSREPCCGTHVFNTADIKDFTFVSVKSLGRSTVSLHAVTGERAYLAINNGKQIFNQIAMLNDKLSGNTVKTDELCKEVTTLRNKLTCNIEDDSIIPLFVKNDCTNILNNISSQLKNKVKESEKDLIEEEIKNILSTKVYSTKKNQRYIVQYLKSSLVLESVPLQKATRLCSNIPVIVIAYTNNMVKARCCIPKELCTDKFNAEKWLHESIVTTFRSHVSLGKDQDGKTVCNMKPRRIDNKDWNELLTNSVKAARKYIEDHL